MKKYLFVIFIGSLCISFSCNKLPEKGNIYYFTRADFPDSIHVKLDTIPISPKILNPISFYVLRDSLLLVRNAQNADYMVEIYNLNTRQPVLKTAHRGRGPKEVLGGFIYYRSESGYFLFHDMISRRFLKYDIDSLLANGENYHPLIQDTPPEAVDVALMDSNRFVFYDDRYLENKEFSNELPELGVENLNSKAKYSAKKFKYYAGTVNGGKIYVSPDCSKIFVFSINDDKINIYDGRFVLQKTLKGPVNHLPEYTIQKNSWGTTSIRCNNSLPAYSLGFSTNDYIYTVYLGYKDFRKYTEIFKLNWEGKLITRYIVDCNINVLSVSNGYMYATAMEAPRSMPKLVRFKI